jgi:hypothetical protein
VAEKICFHLDEHISHAIADALRQRGINVTTTVEAKLRTQSDDLQLAYACQQQKVLVTNDADFLARHAKGEEHFGIVYYPPNRRSIGEVVTYLSLIYETLTPTEMINRVEYL